MDTAFLLDEGARANFLRFLVQSLGCTYICLWSYLPHPSNCLFYLDGFYHEENNQPSSSSGSLAQRLFDEYRQSIFDVENDHVPGLAFKNIQPYIELNELELRKLASGQSQRRFYQEARIKNVVFMGCKSGEIEIGLSNVIQVNMQMEMMNWLPQDFPPQSLLQELPRQTDNNPPSSSSSISLRSLSMGSPECSSLLFTVPGTSYIQDAPIEQELEPVSTTTAINPHQRTIAALSRIRNIQLPTLESEHAAITRALLAVLTSPSTSHQPQQNLPHLENPKASAFMNYTTALAPKIQTKANLRRQSLLKRLIAYFRSLNLSNLLRIRDQCMQGNLPTNTQLHHTITERKRREKLNESFQALRSLLPPGFKKDKASVLASTKEYITSLKALVAELSGRNQLLEAQLLPAEEAAEELTGSSNERFDVRVANVSELTSEERIIDLRVTVRGECPMKDMVIRLLEFLKQVKNVKVMSMEASTQIAEESLINRINLRLKVEGNEWDKSAFQEAVRRVVGDLSW